MAGISDELRERGNLLWEDGPQPSRGPKPTTTRSDIAQAAIAIADRDGLAGLTMSAVAEKLGLTTMALYRYFPRKEALLDAVVDGALGTPPAQPDPQAPWRTQVTHWAHAKRAMLCARPWLAELPFVAAPHGPNWLGWHEGFLQAIAPAGLGPDDMMDMLGVVDGYVRGASDTAISLARAANDGISFEEWAAAVGADLARAIGDPRFPMLSAILSSETGGISETSPLPAREGRPRTMDEHFDFGLARVLDGIEGYVDARKARVT